jgi:hypothetical protein
MKLYRKVAVVGSRVFNNWNQLKIELDKILEEDDEIVSGGALGVDSMAQRYAKEKGHNIKIYYPKYARHGKPATFIRNKDIVEDSDLVLAFYAKGRFRVGGTANSAEWAERLGKELLEFEEV